jgi:hypothetical protein
MGTIIKAQTQTIPITGTDVRDVAAKLWEEIIDIYHFYGRNFPYDKPKLRNDIGQILLWGMSDQLSLQFFELLNGKRIERLSYNYIPCATAQGGNSPPGEYPRYSIQPDWQVRIVARYHPQKSVEEVAEFFDALGWRPSDPLVRTGAGRTEEHGALGSGGIKVKRAVYTDLPDTASKDTKEREV